MAHRPEGKPPRGFSLIEVLVSSVVFLVIFMGLATALQSILMVNHLATGTNECLDRYRLGMRLLKYGDAGIPGLAPAASASVLPDGHLVYDSHPTSGVDREWYLDQGRLMARALPAGTPVAVIGDTPLGQSGVRVTAPQNGAWATSATSASGSCLVRLSLRLFYDTNHNPALATHVCDGNESEMTMHTSIFLRNSDR